MHDHIQDGVIGPAKGLLIELSHEVCNRDLSIMTVKNCSLSPPQGSARCPWSAGWFCGRVQQCRLALRIVLRVTVVFEYRLNMLVQHGFPTVFGVGPSHFVRLLTRFWLTNRVSRICSSAAAKCFLEVCVAQLEALIGLRSPTSLATSTVNNQIFVGPAKQLEIPLQFLVALEPLMNPDD